jgi:hypothetical protein
VVRAIERDPAEPAATQGLRVSIALIAVIPRGFSLPALPLGDDAGSPSTTLAI